MKETGRVLLALLAAILLGVLVAASHNASLIRVADAFAPIGTLWVNGIRMTVIPLVVSLLIVGVASVSDIKSIGRLGGRTLVTFVLLLIGVAAIVIPIALAMFRLLPPHGALELPPGAVEAANDRLHLFAGRCFDECEALGFLGFVVSDHFDGIGH